METEATRQYKMLFTVPDTALYQDMGEILEVKFEELIDQVETAAIGEEEFLSCLRDAQCFSHAHAGHWVYTKFDVTPRNRGCAQVRMHLECIGKGD